MHSVKKAFATLDSLFCMFYFQTEAWPQDECIGTYVCFCVEFWRLLFYRHVIYWDTYQQCTGELQPSSALWLTGGSWVSSRSMMVVLFTRGVALQCHNVLHLRTTHCVNKRRSPHKTYHYSSTLYEVPQPQKIKKASHHRPKTHQLKIPTPKTQFKIPAQTPTPQPQNLHKWERVYRLQ